MQQHESSYTHRCAAKGVELSSHAQEKDPDMEDSIEVQFILGNRDNCGGCTSDECRRDVAVIAIVQIQVTAQQRHIVKHA